MKLCNNVRLQNNFGVLTFRLKWALARKEGHIFINENKKFITRENLQYLRYENKRNN